MVLVLVLPKEKLVFGAVVVAPKDLKKLPAGWTLGGPNRLPVVLLKPLVAATETQRLRLVYRQ